MEPQGSTITKPSDSKTSREIAAVGGNLADLLAAAGNGIRITGLILVVDEPKEFKGKSAKGNDYAFAVQELQIFTGNKAVGCKFQCNIGDKFPDVLPGTVRTFKIKGVRLNGTVPSFELDATE